MTEDEKWKSYFWVGTNIFKNKLNIKNRKLLFEAENSFLAYGVRKILKTSYSVFNSLTLKNIHYLMFGSVYEWAGKNRIVDMSKGGILSYSGCDSISQKLDEFDEWMNGWK